MAESIDAQEKPRKNRHATACLILGVSSVAFAQFCHAPGVCSAVGCVGPILGLAAIVTGILGLRNARQLEGKGQRQAVGGLITTLISFGLFLAVFLPVMLTPGGVMAQLAPTPTPANTPRPTLTPTPTPTPTETPPPTPTPAPVTYSGTSFAITLTDEWEVVQAGSDAAMEVLVVQHLRDTIAFHVYRQTVSDTPDLEAFIERFIADNFGAPTIIEEGEIEVGGQKGITKRFVYESSGRTDHVLLAAVANGNDVYVFLVFASSEEMLTRYRAETDEMISSVRFASQPPPEPTAAATSPTSPPDASPQTYQDELFSLTFPGDWLMMDVSGSDHCSQPHISCVVLVHSVDDIRFLLERERLEEASTVEELDQQMWERFGSTRLLSKTDIEVDGRLGIQRTFTQESDASPTGLVYVLHVMILNENDQYWIIGETTNSDVFLIHQSTMEAIVASIEFAD
jgi:hypothetical protein